MLHDTMNTVIETDCLVKRYGAVIAAWPGDKRGGRAGRPRSRNIPGVHSDKLESRRSPHPMCSAAVW